MSPRILIALATPLLLVAACAYNEEGDVRFKVTGIQPPYESMGKMRPQYVTMDVDQDMKDSPLGLGTTQGAAKDQFPADIKVGDSVVCKVRRSDDNGFDDVDPNTTIGPCKKA